MDALLGGATSDRVRNTDEVVLLLAGGARRTFVKFWNWIANDECGDANENFDSFFLERGANGCYPALRIWIRRGIYEANGIDKALKVRVTYGDNDRTGLDLSQ